MDINFLTEIDEDEIIDEMQGKYLTFSASDQLFGVPISDVIQIIEMQEITPVPYYPKYAKGVINLRGEIIPIIDVRTRFHMEQTEYNDRTCIIISELEDTYMGFIVDYVSEVVEIDEENITDPPAISHDITSYYLNGIGKAGDKVILIIDTNKMLTANEIDVITSLTDETLSTI